MCCEVFVYDLFLGVLSERMLREDQWANFSNTTRSLMGIEPRRRAECVMCDAETMEADPDPLHIVHGYVYS